MELARIAIYGVIIVGLAAAYEECQPQNRCEQQMQSPQVQGPGTNQAFTPTVLSGATAKQMNGSNETPWQCLNNCIGKCTNPQCNNQTQQLTPPPYGFIIPGGSQNNTPTPNDNQFVTVHQGGAEKWLSQNNGYQRYYNVPPAQPFNFLPAQENNCSSSGSPGTNKQKSRYCRSQSYSEPNRSPNQSQSMYNFGKPQRPTFSQYLKQAQCPLNTEIPQECIEAGVEPTIPTVQMGNTVFTVAEAGLKINQDEGCEASNLQPSQFQGQIIGVERKCH